MKALAALALAPWALPPRAAASLLRRGGGCVVEEPSGSPDDCTITRVTLRSDLGFPVQIEKTGDTAYEGTMCEGMSGFRTAVKQAAPVFASGVKCTITGVPQATQDVAPGSSESFTIGVNAFKGENITSSTEYTLVVRRLSSGLDQSPCEVSYQRSAIEDCGYAPMLEKRRQDAALNPSVAEPVAPAPEAAA